ncbi:hypothetical protein QF000_001939 [Paraburkholderia atlantica]|nr:hypothetical protein [Paraburkholderia atlantica]MBB5414751.1 hypothetical protein [Paraburkholderia atlantica]
MLLFDAQAHRKDVPESDVRHSNFLNVVRLYRNRDVATSWRIPEFG